MTGSIVAPSKTPSLFDFGWLSSLGPSDQTHYKYSGTCIASHSSRSNRFNCDHSGSLIWIWRSLFLLHGRWGDLHILKNDSKQHFISPFALLLVSLNLFKKTYLGFYWRGASLSLQCQSFFSQSTISWKIVIQNCYTVHWSGAFQILQLINTISPQLSKYFRWICSKMLTVIIWNSTDSTKSSTYSPHYFA